jgi:hypothetical protein
MSRRREVAPLGKVAVARVHEDKAAAALVLLLLELEHDGVLHLRQPLFRLLLLLLGRFLLFV